MLVITMLVITSAVVIIGFLVSHFVAHRLTHSLRQLVNSANKVAQGDLTHTFKTRSQDELGWLALVMNEMRLKLADTVGRVSEASVMVASRSREIAAGNENLSQRTEEQAASLEETATSMEELTSTVKQNADNARQANKLANAARESAERGCIVVTKAVSAMGEINASSKKVADIIGVIDDIAFQTNLLALNAAVEAARAGEQGRGFSVVAAEVRNLAQRSATSAKEIKGLIGDSVEKIKNGDEFVDETGRTLQEIVNSVKKVSDIVAEISAASQEQSSGIDQVNKAIIQMDEMTQQNAALVEQAAAASRTMEEQAEVLSELMAKFKVSVDVERSSTPIPSRPYMPEQISADRTNTERRSASRAKNVVRISKKNDMDTVIEPVAKVSGSSDEWQEF
jgi:methyl-accepting chemotaxis protein